MVYCNVGSYLRTIPSAAKQRKSLTLRGEPVFNAAVPEIALERTQAQYQFSQSNSQTAAIRTLTEAFALARLPAASGSPGL